MASRKGTSKPSPAQIAAWAAGNKTGAAIILASDHPPDSLMMRWARMILPIKEVNHDARQQNLKTRST